MSTSQFIASLIGPTLIVVGALMLLRRQYFLDLTQRMASDHAAIFLAGLLAFVAGLAILRVHNVWTADWRMAVTIFGWLAVIGGIFRMAFADAARDLRDEFAGLRNAPVVGGAVAIAIGLFFSLAAYGFL
ncbi:MAG: hypothetical protein AB7L18_01955 [Hyphomicrobiaceae bacterium]